MKQDQERSAMKKWCAGWVILLLLLSITPAQAGAPLNTVQTNVNRVLEILRDPQLKGSAAKEIKKEKLRLIYDVMFDKVELSRRTLARNWNGLSAAERQEFVQLFKQILEKAYIDKILDYAGEKVVFDRETPLSENQAEVQTRIVTASKEIPITYRVILSGGQWRVYDVIVENVSLILNYRTQFNDILGKNKPEQLIEILRKKVAEQQS
jgi:phospholipid transport system substrate-binding protein